MQKVDKSVMDQELKKVSEQIPPLLFSIPSPGSPAQGNGTVRPRQNLAGGLWRVLPPLFIWKSWGSFSKVVPSTPIFSDSGFMTICDVNLKIMHQLLCHRKALA